MKKVALNNSNFFKLINQFKDLQFKDIEIDNLSFSIEHIYNIIKVTDEDIQRDSSFIDSNVILPEKVTLRKPTCHVNKVDFSNTFIEIDAENASIKLHQSIIDLSKLIFKKLEKGDIEFYNCCFINDLEDIPNIQVSAKMSDDFWLIPLEMLPPKFTYFLVFKHHLDEILKLNLSQAKKSKILAEKIGYAPSSSTMYKWALKLKDTYDR